MIITSKPIWEKEGKDVETAAMKVAEAEYRIAEPVEEDAADKGEPME